MGNDGLTLTIIAKVQSANYGEGIGNISTLKKATLQGADYTVISRQALRYSLIKALGWDSTPCEVHKSVAQFSTDATILDYPEIDLFGYMKTKTSPAQKRSAPVRLNPAISLTPYTDETEILTNLGLASRVNDDAKKNGLMPSTSEQHTSYYAYTITIDLDRIGVDVVAGKKLEVSQEEKAKRVNALLEQLQFNWRDIKGRRENLMPLFVVGGLYPRKNPFFMNCISVDKKVLDVEAIKEIKDATSFLKENTKVGVTKSAFDNYAEIVSVLEASTVADVFESLQKEVSDYYGR